MKKLMKSVLACALAFAMVMTVMPVNTYAASKKAVVVINQKQLEKALKNGATNIVIKTNKAIKITIPASKKAAKASISVQAKNATITNKASVKSIEIKDAKAFVESGKNNDIKITDSKLSLTVAKAAKGADIQIAKKNADIKVVANGSVASVTVSKTANVALTVNKTAKVASVNVTAKGASVDLNAKGTVSSVKVSEKAADTKLNINASGKVQNVQIDAKADVAVAGSTTEAVKVTVNAKDTTIKAETPIDTTLNADTKLDLSKGAEGSTVTTAENVKADVANNTTDKVSVKDSTGKETTVDAGTTETKTDDGKKDDEKKDDQKTDDDSGTVTPAPDPTPTPDPAPTHEPGVEFTKTSDQLNGEVSYDESTGILGLEVQFQPVENAWGSDGQELDEWPDIINIHESGNSVTLQKIDCEGLILTAYFALSWECPVGPGSFSFDYETYESYDIDASSKPLGTRTYTVNYNVSQDTLNQIKVPYVTNIAVISEDTIAVDFSQGVRNTEDGIAFEIKNNANDDKLEIKNFSQDGESWQRYVVTLVNPLAAGEYTVVPSFYGKTYDGGSEYERNTFSYNPELWTEMDAVREIASEQLKESLIVTDTTVKRYYAKTFKSLLATALRNKGYTVTDSSNDYEELLNIGSDGSNERRIIEVDEWKNPDVADKVHIMVHIMYGNNRISLYDDCSFSIEETDEDIDE